jgi:hypothetical protein
MPHRIQRQRTNGWRMPANAVYVGRPTRWGNPFPVAKYQDAVRLFADWLSHTEPGRALAESARQELRGKDLACWCRPDQPCHADVLLDLANKPRPEERGGDRHGTA